MVRERAPYHVIDRRVVGEPLGLDDELAHNPHARSRPAAHAIGFIAHDSTAAEETDDRDDRGRPRLVRVMVYWSPA
jgi:hypothetical protein